MSLQSYLSNSWIRTHQTSAEEIANLLAIVERDIQQSQTPGLGDEWRFDIAYNAVLQCGTAALAATGYRAERQNKHARTIECLEFTLGSSKSTVRFLDQCRRKRHRAVYGRSVPSPRLKPRSSSRRPKSCAMNSSSGSAITIPVYSPSPSA